MTVHVATICTGNICRSPMAEVVLRDLIARDDGLAGEVRVTSAGLDHWHVGDPMDGRSRRALDQAGYPGPGSRARHADAPYLDAQDLVIVMTREHREEVWRRSPRDPERVVLLRNLGVTPLDLDLADPYYGQAREFDDCLRTITEHLTALVNARRHSPRGPRWWIER